MEVKDQFVSSYTHACEKDCMRRACGTFILTWRLFTDHCDIVHESTSEGVDVKSMYERVLLRFNCFCIVFDGSEERKVCHIGR